MERKVNSGLKNLACAGVAALALGSANANSLDDYVRDNIINFGENEISRTLYDTGNNRNNFEKNETFKLLDYDVKVVGAKDIAQFGGGLVAGLLSHEVAHKLVGNALGMGSSYNPLKDPFTVYNNPLPAKNNFDQALFSIAGFITQNTAAAYIVNSDIDLRENPAALGTVAFAIYSNLAYVFHPESRKKSENIYNDVSNLSKATGIPGDIIGIGLIATTAYLAKKVVDNFNGEKSSNTDSNFSPHFGRDGNFGVQYKPDRSLWSISAELNPISEYAGLVLNVSLDGKRD